MWASGKVIRDLSTVFNNPPTPPLPNNRMPNFPIINFLILFLEHSQSFASVTCDWFRFKPFKKLLTCKPFQKRLERKPQETFKFEYLIPKPYRRDKPAQRFRRNGFGPTVVAQNLNLSEFEISKVKRFQKQRSRLFARNDESYYKKLMKPRSGFEPGLNRSAGDCVTAPPPWQSEQSVELNTAY